MSDFAPSDPGCGRHGQQDSLLNDQHFVVQHGGDFEGDPACVHLCRQRLASNESFHGAAFHAWWQVDGGLEGAGGDELINRCAPGNGQVHDVGNYAAGLGVEVAVEEAVAFETEGDFAGGGPVDEVGEEIGVVGERFQFVAAVDIGGHEGAVAFDDETGNGGYGLAHPCGLGGINGEDRNERQGDEGVAVHLEVGEGAAKGDDVGFGETFEDGVARAGNFRFIGGVGSVDAGAHLG